MLNQVSISKSPAMYFGKQMPPRLISAQFRCNWRSAVCSTTLNDDHSHECIVQIAAFASGADLRWNTCATSGCLEQLLRGSHILHFTIHSDAIMAHGLVSLLGVSCQTHLR